MIFNYTSDSEYLTDYFASCELGGRGQSKKLAQYLGISSAVVSQTLSGQRFWSSENAFLVSKYLDLSPIETKYFLKMVEYNKAANHELKSFLLSELTALQKEGNKLKSRYQNSKELSEKDKFQFYSEKLYSAIRMASALPELETSSQIAAFLKIDERKCEEILQFLIERNLVVKKNGKLERGHQHTFVPADSPYVKNHHRNWRIHSLERIDHVDNDQELMYSAPMSLSKKDYQKLRENLLKTINDTITLLGPSKDEVVACLNIDLLKF